MRIRGRGWPGCRGERVSLAIRKAIVFHPQLLCLCRCDLHRRQPWRLVRAPHRVASARSSKAPWFRHAGSRRKRPRLHGGRLRPPSAGFRTTSRGRSPCLPRVWRRCGCADVAARCTVLFGPSRVAARSARTAGRPARHGLPAVAALNAILGASRPPISASWAHLPLGFQRLATSRPSIDHLVDLTGERSPFQAAMLACGSIIECDSSAGCTCVELDGRALEHAGEFPSGSSRPCSRQRGRALPMHVERPCARVLDPTRGAPVARLRKVAATDDVDLPGGSAGSRAQPQAPVLNLLCRACGVVGVTWLARLARSARDMSRNDAPLGDGRGPCSRGLVGCDVVPAVSDLAVPWS